MTTRELDVIDVALIVARAIESVGGQYFVGGSIASSLQGEPRATNDIDFVLDMPIGRVGGRPIPGYLGLSTPSRRPVGESTA